MERDNLLKQFEKEFELMKKELKFKSTLNELDKIFFIRDHILSAGWISRNLSRVICSRIVDTYQSWNGYLHSLIMPNMGSFLNMTESQIFDERDKKDMIQIMSRIMAFSTKNTLIGLTKDKKEEAKFIDDSVKIWNKVMKPKMVGIIKKANDYWNGKIQKKY